MGIRLFFCGYVVQILTCSVAGDPSLRLKNGFAQEDATLFFCVVDTTGHWMTRLASDQYTLCREVSHGEAVQSFGVCGVFAAEVFDFL